MLTEFILRFVIGGLVVSLFSVLGDLFRPKSFAGLFDAAPSVALATLALAVAKEDALYAGIESRSMIAGALALLVYSQLTSWLLMRDKCSSLVASVASLPAWFAVAFALWWALLK
ncbi:MAG TPA: DUF3147 family protein [Burkholderiales bacterium]|nr:DUF3147 family protein [Burkholderiales bacterium]